MQTERPNKPDQKNRAERERIIMKQQKWLLPAIVVLSFFAVSMVFFFITREAQVEIASPSYQYAFTEKYEFNAGSVMKQGRSAMTISDIHNPEEFYVDRTPVYESEDTRMYLTADACWFDPVNLKEWRIPALSSIAVGSDGIITCTVGKKSYVLPGGFLNDCQGTYILLDRCTVLFNGQYIPVEPFSFFSTEFGIVRLYNYGDHEFYSSEDMIGKFSLDAKRGYTLDMSTGIFTSSEGDTRLLIASPKFLHDLEERR